ncbi:hypothetical protein ACFSW8_12970 [Rubritalea tangerina]|uniref:PEP-CTERM sorting domain-containing protein n=1 Tax=Rubritalea tangerina TaxID=430798 RepID=A0ABW4ZCS4_9BACT
MKAKFSPSHQRQTLLTLTLVSLTTVTCLQAVTPFYTLDFEEGDESGYQLFDDANLTIAKDHITGVHDRIVRTSATADGYFDLTPTGNNSHFIALEDLDANDVQYSSGEGFLSITDIDISGAVGIT